MREERDWKMKRASHTAAKEKDIDMYYAHHDFSKTCSQINSSWSYNIIHIKKIVINLF